MNGWFCTQSGRRVFISNPRPESIVIEDIAHALSNLCRFGGHVDRFYSVAQHSVLVSLGVPRPLAKAALLHDASEAYLGDVIRPLKNRLSVYTEIEETWQAVIEKKFNIAPSVADRATIKEADMRALVTERRDLGTEAWTEHKWVEDEAGVTPFEGEVLPQSPKLARAMFLKRWDQVR